MVARKTTYFQPAVDVLEKSGLFGARHVDYGVKGDSGVKALRRKRKLGHIRFQESACGDVLTGEIQLPGRDVHAGDGEASVGKPACYGHTCAAAKIQHRCSRR
jgi:hypothetical protein